MSRKLANVDWSTSAKGLCCWAKYAADPPPRLLPRYVMRFWSARGSRLWNAGSDATLASFKEVIDAEPVLLPYLHHMGHSAVGNDSATK